MTPIRVKLRELRTARGLTQQQLAESAGVHQGTISELEAGKTARIDFAVLDRLCGALADAPLKDTTQKEIVRVGDLLERDVAKKRR